MADLNLPYDISNNIIEYISSTHSNRDYQKEIDDFFNIVPQ